MIVDSALPEVAPSDGTESPVLPHGPIDLPPKSGRDRLVDDLVARGMREGAAVAVARAVVSPRSARAQLRAPVRRRVAGGALEVVFAPVFVAAVSASPVNPRTEAACAYPAGGVRNQRPPLPAPKAADGAAELILRAETEQVLLGSLEQATGALLGSPDAGLIDDIRLDGIREPLLLVAASIRHENGRSTPPILISADGSTRVASAHEVLGLSPSDVLYHFRVHEDRRYRSWMSDLKRLAESKLDDDLTDDEKAHLRSCIAPAEIVVGWIPDESIDIARAIDSRLGQIHVDPPSKWSDAAKLDHQLNAAIDALDEAGQVTTESALYLAGLLTPDEAVAHGFGRELDDRALEALSVFVPKNEAVNAALRQLASRPTKISTRARLRVAAEAAIRPLRVELTTSKEAEARNALEATFHFLSDAIDLGTWEPSGAGLVALRDTALAEVRGREAMVGPATAELLARGMFWLAVRGAASMSTRGGMADRRQPAQVLLRLSKSTHAMHVLYQAVVDGRAGKQPRKVESDGRLWISTGADRDEITETWLRSEVIPKEEGSLDDEIEIETTPEEELIELEAELVTEAKQLADAFAALTGPRGSDGTPLVQTRGVALVTADSVVQRVNAVRDGILEYRTLARLQTRGTASDDVVEEVIE